MKIGIFRHFRTAHHFLGRSDSSGYDRKYSAYENTHIIPPGQPVRLDNYACCYASPAARTMETARAVFGGDIIPCEELREVPLKAVFQTKIRLPVGLWHFINRTAWIFDSRKLPETRTQSKKRAAEFLDKLLSHHGPGKKNGDILLVTHGFFIVVLQRQLVKRGFKGKISYHPRHGALYEFQASYKHTYDGKSFFHNFLI
jgi:hypothetical protein